MHLLLNGKRGDVQPATKRGSSSKSPALCSLLSSLVLFFLYFSKLFWVHPSIQFYSCTNVFKSRVYIWKRKGLIGLFHGSKWWHWQHYFCNRNMVTHTLYCREITDSQGWSPNIVEPLWRTMFGLEKKWVSQQNGLKRSEKTITGNLSKRI